MKTINCLVFIFVVSQHFTIGGCFLYSWSIKGTQTFIKDSVLEESVRSNIDYVGNLTGFIFKQGVNSAAFQNMTFEFTLNPDSRSDFQLRSDFMSKRELKRSILLSLVHWLRGMTTHQLIPNVDIDERGRLSRATEQLIEKTFKPKFLLTTERKHFTFKYVIENSTVIL